MYDAFIKTDKLFSALALAGVAGWGLEVNPARANSAGSELAPEEAAQYTEFADYDWEPRSSVHYDMVRALARCAGFDSSTATKIAEVSEATDVGQHYDAKNFGDRGGTNSDRMHWPNAALSTSPGDFEDTLAPIKGWAMGTISTLIDPTTGLKWYNCKVPGSPQFGKCCNEDDQNCIDRGSEDALATALHSIADAYSHKACVDRGGSSHSGYPSGTGAYCGNENNHGNEFGGVKCTETSSSTACDAYATFHPAGSYIDYASPNTELVENNIAGIEAMRDYIEEWRNEVRGTGHICNIGDSEVTNDEIESFVGLTSFKLRMDEAARLFDECDKDIVEGGCGPDDFAE